MKELKIMKNDINRALAAKKTLRYLLITFAVMMVMSVSAQGLAEKPTAQFQSTSSLVGSGSTLPQAAQTGAYTTYDMNASSHKSGIRKGIGGDDGDITIPDDNTDPDATPIGEGIWALLFCAAIFSGVIAFRRKRQQRNV